MSKEVLEIECSHCKENNDINLSEEVKCKSCGESLTTKKYAKKKIISASTALAVGLGGGLYIDEKFETDRYPIKTEYNIIQSCLSNDNRALSESNYKKKIDICICAQEKTMSDITYSEFKNNQVAFIKIFSENVKKCD